MTTHRVAIRRTLAATAIVVVAALAATACGDDTSDAEKAKTESETLQKGLDAHVAGDLDTAEKQYRQVLADDDKNALAYYNLALVEQTTDRLDDAEAHYRKALLIDPNMESALFNLAILRSQAGATDEARSLYTQVISLDPGNAGAHLNLGFLYQDLGQGSDAQREFAAALAIDPTLQSRIVGLDTSGAATATTDTTEG